VGNHCVSTGPGTRICDDVDECMDGHNGGCGDPQLTDCRNANPGRTCLDRNECNVNNGNCGDPSKVLCRNLEPGTGPGPGFVCDHCALNPCPGGTCTESATAPNYQCTDINECAANPRICGANKVCVNLSPGYACQCVGDLISDGHGGCKVRPKPPSCPCGGARPACRVCS
jgi:hypothetical protein